jgi:lipoprotein-anchoring transpeptidase ErfK/SrfK
MNLLLWLWVMLAGLPVTASNAIVNYLNRQGAVEPTQLTGEFDPQEKMGVFHGRAVTLPNYLAYDLKSPAQVLGISTNNKRIEVDLTNQKLYAVENEQRVMEFLISSGKWGWTPTGEFKIWMKLTSTKMSGGSKALRTYYYLPNVPYTMYFYNAEIPQSRGYGIHGAYWHNNFGHPMSHGCINMRPDDAKTLFYWADPPLPEGKRMMNVEETDPSTPIVIYGAAPTE